MTSQFNVPWLLDRELDSCLEVLEIAIYDVLLEIARQKTSDRAP
jgi:hypothetical protein